MEVKPTYKQTEVGVIPEEWDAVPAGSIGRFRGGNGFSLEAQGETAGDYPFFKVSDMNNAGNETFMGSSNNWISEQTRKRLGATLFPIGSIVFAKVGAAVFLERKRILGQPSCIDNNMAAYVLDERRADLRFVHTQLLSKKFGALVATTALPALNGRQLGEMVLALPPLPEQRTIAEALCDVDGLLDGLDRLIAKKRNLKQAAMQQLLTGQTRLPGFHSEWEVKRLTTIIETPVTDGPHLTPEFLGDGIPFLSVNNLVGNKIDLTELRFISRQDHEVFSRKCKPRRNDILLGKAASVGKVAIVELDCEFNIWSPIALIRVSSNHAARFIYYQLQSADLIGQITLLTNSSSQGNIGMSDIEKLTLDLPRFPEQTAIAEVLTAMDAELTALEQRREKTHALKQAMMQELLTGRTRLV